MKRAMSLAVLFTTWLPVPAGGEITRYPYLQPTEDLSTSVLVAWQTAGMNGGTVRFGRPHAAQRTAKAIYDGRSSLGRHRYHARLTGLTPGVEYAYRVVSDGTETPTHRFTTSSHAKDSTCRVLLISDTHFEPPGRRPRNTANFRKLLPAFLAFRPNVVLHMGDVVLEHADAGAYATAFAAGKELWAQSLFCPVAGNHDEAKDRQDGLDFRLFAEQFYYPENGPEPSDRENIHLKRVIGSFDYGGIHFATFGAGFAGLGGKAFKNGNAWLTADLAKARESGRVANIILRGHMSGASEGIIAKFDPVLSLTGHSHTYARGFPTAPGLPAVEEKKNYGTNVRGVISAIIPATAWAGSWVPPGRQAVTCKAVGYAEVKVSKGGHRIEVTVYAEKGSGPRQTIDHFVIERDVRRGKAKTDSGVHADLLPKNRATLRGSLSQP